jgi:hypothetical protein
MSETVDRYRRRRSAAASALEPSIKQEFAVLAQEWLALADQWDWVERRFRHRKCRPRIPDRPSMLTILAAGTKYHFVQLNIGGTAGREPARPGETGMHLLVLMILAAAVTGASAQTSTSQANPPPSSDQSSPTDLSAHQQHIEQQPQGSTGPLDTTSGGAPAESPQGQSPPGMQAAPEGSSKVITNGK